MIHLDATEVTRIEHPDGSYVAVWLRPNGRAELRVVRSYDTLAAALDAAAVEESLRRGKEIVDTWDSWACSNIWPPPARGGEPHA